MSPHYLGTQYRLDIASAASDDDMMIVLALPRSKVVIAKLPQALIIIIITSARPISSYIITYAILVAYNPTQVVVV